MDKKNKKKLLRFLTLYRLIDFDIDINRLKASDRELELIVLFKKKFSFLEKIFKFSNQRANLDQFFSDMFFQNFWENECVKDMQDLEITPFEKLFHFLFILNKIQIDFYEKEAYILVLLNYVLQGDPPYSSGDIFLEAELIVEKIEYLERFIGRATYVNLNFEKEIKLSIGHHDRKTFNLNENSLKLEWDSMEDSGQCCNRCYREFKFVIPNLKKILETFFRESVTFEEKEKIA